jgi:predicted HAD superfamily Cof-like phosphohydrolase
LIKWAEDVRRFMEASGQTTGKMNPEQAALYLGLQCEELAEKLRRLGWTDLADDLHRTGLEIRHDGAPDLAVADRDKLADDNFDLLWVTIAAMHSEGIDPETAWLCGAPSNLAKIVHGKVQKDETGKVKKPSGWQEPDFRPSVL